MTQHEAEDTDDAVDPGIVIAMIIAALGMWALLLLGGVHVFQHLRGNPGLGVLAALWFAALAYMAKRIMD